MRLETERLVLRPLSLDDLDALAPFFADPDVMRYMGGKTLTRVETEASIARMVGWFEADGFGQLAVVRKDDGDLLGRCGILIWETEPWKPLARAEANGETETRSATRSDSLTGAWAMRPKQRSPFATTHEPSSARAG